MYGRKAGTLIVGLVLILAGALFLASNLVDLRVDWFQILKYSIPVLCVAAGAFKLIRHYSRPPEYWSEGRGKSSLLSGLFWLSFGAVVFFSLLGLLELLAFVGLYWPVLLIGFGLAKIVDHYRIAGGIRVRTAEVFGVVFIVVFGLACGRLAKAHLPLIDDLTWGDFRISLPEGLEGRRFRFETSQALSLEGVREVQVENLYGDVVVENSEEGSADLRFVTQVRGERQEQAEELNRDVRVNAVQAEGILSISTNRKELGEKGRGIGTNMYLHLPSGLPLSVSNGFGQVRVTDRNAALTVANSYGGVRVSNQNGDLTVANRNGPVDARSVTGAVKIVNQRAPITIDGVEGSVDAATEYDSLRAEHVRGNLVARNHFGSIRLADIQGEVSVAGDGSSVNAEQVTRRLQVKNSHKQVRIRNVSGGLELETSYSRVELAQVRGGVSVQALHSEVSAKDLEDSVTVTGKGSEIRLAGISGPLSVETSLRKVAIEDFRGPVSVQNEFGEIVVESRRSPADPLRIVNKNGTILLSLPKESNFRLTAQAVGGEIESDFGVMAEAERPAAGGLTLFEATVGKGGPLVELQTSHSRIRIRKRG